MSFNIGDNYIDSRDIIARIEELERDEEALDDDEKDELETLRKAAEEGEQYASDWEYGAQLIHEDCFVDYCREKLEDCGYPTKDLPWWIEIAWDKTSDNLREDYTEIEIGGRTYLVLRPPISISVPAYN